MDAKNIDERVSCGLCGRVMRTRGRGDLIEKRKVLMQVWADYCASAPSDASVARLRRVD